jgi:nucleoside-diphosphate-sugar epimerase
MNGTNIYNVSVPAIKMKDIVETVALALGKSAPSWHIPASLALNAANALKYLSFNTGRIRSIYATLQKWLADDYCLTDKFYKTYNFQAKVNIEEGITREIA